MRKLTTRSEAAPPARNDPHSEVVPSSQPICPIKNWADLKTRLTGMKRASKRADFDSELEQDWLAVNAFLNSLTEAQRKRLENAPEYWKARTLVHELNDVFKHDPAINDKVFEDGPRVVIELTQLEEDWTTNPQLKNQKQTSDFRTLTREKVLFCSRYGSELKRREDTLEASRTFDSLLRFTEHHLQTEEMPCFGTRAALSYGLATIRRQLEDYKSAREYYAKAIDLYCERVKRRGEHDQDDFLFTTGRIAMCIGLGFGRIAFTRGRLRRAENAFTTARALLTKFPRWVVVDYIEYLYGALKRCRAGSDEESMKEAIDALKLARAAFEERHVLYETRVARELALAYNLIGNCEEAWSLALLTESRALEDKGIRSKVEAYVLKSRILRRQGKYKEALAEADQAVKFTEQTLESLPQVDALIARGECLLGLAHSTRQRATTYDKARSVFQAANEVLVRKDDSGSKKLRNPKIAAVCELRTAQCYARVKDRRNAEAHFAKYRRLRKKVEHEWVRELAAEVRKEIDELSTDFFISGKDAARFDSSARIGELQRWMVDQALAETKNKSEAAKLLGIKRPRLYSWLKNPTPKRAPVVQDGKNMDAV